MGGNLSDNVKYVASPDAASCALGDGTALLDLRSGTYYSMNVVATHIWGMIQAPMPIADIISSVGDAFDVTEADCAIDVRNLLHELTKLGLVEQGENNPDG